MYDGPCHSGTWGSLGDFGLGGWLGLGLTLILWVGLISGLVLFVVWAIRRARVPAATVPPAGGQPTAGGQDTATEILQAQYARGEITRDQYELKKQDIGKRKVSESLKGESK